MLGHLGTHIFQFPTGRWGYVGTLPTSLGTLVKATSEDIMAGRATTSPHDGIAYTVKFPTFDTKEQAEAHLDLCVGRVAKVTQGPLVIARLTGRCADGAQRGGGVRTHLVPLGETYGVALCGARPGRLSSGWDEVDGPELPSCVKCQKRAYKTLGKETA